MAKNTDENTPTTDKEDEPAQDYGQYEDDVIERPFRRRNTISLNRQRAPEPGLSRWAEELGPYEEPFPKYDAHGRVVVASLAEILQTVAQWYVRKNNKYYDVDVPGEVLSRDDVERVIIQRLKVSFPGNKIPQDVVRQILQKLIRDIFVSPRESIPIWSGIRKSIPGNPNKLIFSPHMTATINTWRVPSYRQLGEDSADWGPFEAFLETMFPREEERDMLVNWLAWCLQNEGEKPGWAPFLYSSTKGSGKSTLASICAKLFGVENSSTENNVSKLVSRFNAPVLENKFVICEELQIPPGSDKANAVKTFITERHTMTEHKGHDVQLVEQVCAFMFTTNHIPLWLERGDRRFYVVEIDHDGHRFGPRGDAFAALVAETLEYLEDPRNLAMLYNALMRYRLPKDFSALSLDVQGSSTHVMKTIQSASWDLNVELFEDELNRMELVAIPASALTSLSEALGNPKANVIKHWLLNLNWSRHKVKWGGADYARVIFLRPGYQISGGTLYGPEGWSHTPGGSSAFAEYRRQGLLSEQET